MIDDVSANNQRQAVINKLDELGVSYDLVDHPAVFTIEEMERIDLCSKDEIVKNLFLRDDKKKRFILLVLSKEKQVNLKKLSQSINSRPLSFASVEFLDKVLGLSKGSVTPLGILNDDSRMVEIFIDRSLLSRKRIGIHPNDNTATVFLSLKDLEHVIADHGNKFEYVET